VNDVVAFLGHHAVSRFQKEGHLFVPSANDVAALSLLVHELNPEARYSLLGSMADRLRYPGPLTEYFTQVQLELWGHDLNDHEEVDIRQQIVRVLLERFAGFYPQPPGLLRVVMELVKDEKYMFFDQSFIKADREIAEQFIHLAGTGLRGMQ
jgi:CCR4-NOT transcription complex subunit 1